MRYLVCPICGKTFETRLPNCLYCSPECRQEGERRRRGKYDAAWREKHKHDPKPANPPKMKREKPATLAEIARRATAAGMTYGKYTAKERNRHESR